MSSLLLEHRANPMQTAHDGSTPLHFACAAGQADCVALLCETLAGLDDEEADIDEFARGVTPLIIACSASLIHPCHMHAPYTSHAFCFHGRS